MLQHELEALLATRFPTDTIEPVPKGVHGGDVSQHVRDANGNSCGTIIWESKRTKAWSDGWLPKLRDDQREAKAERVPEGETHARQTQLLLPLRRAVGSVGLVSALPPPWHPTTIPDIQKEL